MTAYVFDTSALLTLRDDEPGAETVAELLAEAANDRTHCYVCFISLMEIYDRIWKDEGRLDGKSAYTQCQALPVEIVHESKTLLEAASELKANHTLSVADAWIAATAQMLRATLVHKDPEFAPLRIPQIVLPYK